MGIPAIFQDSKPIPNEIRQAFQEWSRERLQASVMDCVNAGWIEAIPFDRVKDQDIRQMYQSKEMLFALGQSMHVVGFRLNADHLQMKHRGGKRQGAGRPAVDALYRRELVTVRLPAWLAEWLKRQADASRIIEQALVECYGLKSP